ncbi:MAG: nodulation protein NfeD [Odoribacteraceae bacterium]|jgi:membrane-bound serine protease (ClpP class)|nr:nodulation protein NfeD [Odoribacteraceae bacterium]
MKRLVLSCMTALLCALTCRGEDARVPVVYKVEIRDEIGAPVWRLARRSFARAMEEGADYIVIHMNTYGGRVDYADSLRSMILRCPIPVWVFIDNNAASAGALISIACHRIYMREGASIGAATVVDATGEVQSEKMQSYMRTMMRSTAQARGMKTVVNSNGDTIARWRRDPAIAEAMVDADLEVEGVTVPGKLVSFTAREAMEHGFCDGIAASIEEMTRMEGVVPCELRAYEVSTLDAIIGFLMHPILQGLLIMVIVGGVYFELQTPGVGFPLVAAMTACALYFAPLYLEGLATHVEILLFVAGIVLLLLEIFVIPGFGVTGVAGIACILGGLALAGIDDFSLDFAGDFAWALCRSLFFVLSCAVISLLLSLRLGPMVLGSRRLGFALRAAERVEDGYVGVDTAAAGEVGRQGVAFTDLRPSGKARVGDEIYDAVSNTGAFIPRGTPVRVVKFQAGQVYVER